MHHIEQESVLDSYTNDLKTNLETALLGPYLIRDAMRDASYTKTQFETLAKHILKHSDGSQTIQLAPIVLLLIVIRLLHTKESLTVICLLSLQ